jgi:nucleoside 2-deoxyribosyltransferase
MSDQQQLRFDAPEDDPVAVYLASGLTALNEDQLTIVELVSGLVAGFCGEAGVLVHQPVMHTHPRDHASLEAEEVHAKDFTKVIESDAVIAIGDFASWGAGKELAWAERLRVPVLLLHREHSPVSRLITGTTGDIEVATWRFHDEIREAWTTYFVARRAQLEAHRRIRARRRSIWAPTLQRVRATHDALSGDEQREVAAIAHLSTRRVHEMLSSPITLAEASLDEVQALVNALGLPSTAAVPGGELPQLPPRALSALATASELEGWEGRHAVELLQRATAELAKGGVRRLSFNEPTDWVDFDHG